VTSARRIAGISLCAGLLLAAAAAKSDVPATSDGAKRAEQARDVDAGEDSDAVMRGFDDGGLPSQAPEPSQPGAESGLAPDAGAAPEPLIPERWWDLTGYTSLVEAFGIQDHRATNGTSYQGLVGLRARGGLQLDLDLPRDWKARAAGSAFYDFAYLIRGRGEYTDAVLDSYEWDADVGELWVEGPLLPDLDLKLGRQIVNWGRSDTLRVLDVLNPIDNREPGLVDLVDLRLPVGMAKLSYYPFAGWSVTGIAIPEIRFSLDPRYGNDFFPFAAPLPPQTTSNGFTAKHAQWAAAVSGNFEGWDVSFHFADAYEDVPRLDPTSQQPGGYQMKHSLVLLGGVGGDYAFGSWLVKSELAVLDGIDFATTGKKTRIDGMLGLEYYGIAESTFALEIVERHLHDYDDSMKSFPDYAQRDTVETALRWSADWWQARLHTVALAIVVGERAQDGSMLRFSADYDIRDALTVGAGIQIFLSGNSGSRLTNPYSPDPYADNDRVFLRLKYSF
jgi:hypothetical protein